MFHERPVLPRRIFATALLVIIVLSGLHWPAISEQVLSPAAQRGLVFVRTNCARCHSIDRVSNSTLPMAPPFRSLHERYPVENLQESLAEGIITGHPSMPEFRLDPDQITDVIAYLKTLEAGR
jgi:mono/diheme cytochrome c family protein